MILCVRMFIMQKDFDNWNEKKKKIQLRNEDIFFHDREIWWCSLGINIGFEQDGAGEEYYRPILILKGLSAQTFLAIPLTTSTNKHKFRPYIGKVEDKDAHALISQMRVIDSKRLIHKIGYLDKKMFIEIRKTVRSLF